MSQSLIHKTKQFKKYVFNLEMKNERFIDQNNEINNVNMKFINFLIIAQTQIQIVYSHQQIFEKIKSQRSIKILNSFMFFDENKTFIRSFLFVIRIKIKINANHFQKKTFKNIQLNMIEYVYFKFEKTIAVKILSLIFVERFITIIEFFEYIERIFEDFDLVFIVQAKIRNCKQKNRFFDDYLVEFQMYIENIDYNEIVQRTTFFENLFNEFKKYLIIVF